MAEDYGEVDDRNEEDDEGNDEDDIIGFNVHKIYNIRELSEEESGLDPRLRDVLDKFGRAHPYLCDSKASWNVEDFMSDIEKSMTAHHIKEDVDYTGMTVKDGTQPVIHRPPIEEARFFRDTRNQRRIIGVIGDEDSRQFEAYPHWVECDVTIYLEG